MFGRRFGFWLAAIGDTVKNALASEEPPKYERAPVSTSFDAFQVRVMGLLRDCLQISVMVLVARIDWNLSEKHPYFLT